MQTNTLLVAIAVCSFAGVASADDKKMDFGKREFVNSCAVCHGQDGKGQTQIIDVLKAAPPDLRLLSRKNGGVFPASRVYETIDGRVALKAHGTRDMPIWGQRFSADGASTYDDYGYNAEALIRARILGIVDYVYRLQEK
jgi:mono/diheme cytochrome c family protein